MPEPLQFDGANPLRSIVSPHSSAPDDTGRYPFVTFLDLDTDAARRIRKRRGLQLVGSVPGTIKAIHEFERVSTTGAVERHIFVASTTGIYSYGGGAVFNVMALPIVPTASDWGFVNFANRCFAWNGADAAIVFDGTSWRKVGIAPPAAAPDYTLGGIYNVGSVFATNESGTIDGTVPAIWSSAMNGKLMVINGISYRISTVDVFGDGVSVPPKLTLAENFHEATSAGLPYAIHAGLMDWATPPFYAFAYEDPATGHMSDLSPVREVTQRDQTGVTPQITIPGSQQNTDAYNAGYLRIALFRSAKNASELRKVNVAVNNRNDGQPIVFTESSATYRDIALLDTMGPQDTNREPPSGFVAMAAWMGRLWALRTRGEDIGRLYFSCLAGEIPVGRAEESWPRRFNRYGIARPVGLLSVGMPGSRDALIIQASDGDYTIDGYDNFTFTPPYRLPTRNSGGFRLGAIDVRGDLVQLYRDKRLFQSGADLGAAVQDKLDAINPAVLSDARLHWFSYEEDDALFVSFARSPSAVNDYTLVFDYDGERICEWSFGFNAAGTTHTLGGVAEMGIGIGSSVYRLLMDVWDDNGVQYAPRFRTAPIRFPLRQMLRRIRLFVGPAASTPELLSWLLKVWTDESPVALSGTFYVVAAERQSAAGRELVFEPAQETIFNAIEVEVTYPQTSTEIYVEKMLIEYDNAQDSEADQ